MVRSGAMKQGKVVDYLAASFDYIARCAGGHNAGHTVIYSGKRFVLQLIPCGILRPGKHAVIGSASWSIRWRWPLSSTTLARPGSTVTGRLHLSNRAHLIFRITGKWKRRRKRRAARENWNHVAWDRSSV